MKATEWTEAFASGKMDDKLSLLYGNAKATLEQQRQRYVDAIQAFTELYPEREDLYIYSAGQNRSRRQPHRPPAWMCVGCSSQSGCNCNCIVS